MRAVFVLRSVAIHGGVERVVADKMNYLAEQGHEISLVTYEQGTHPYVYQLNTHVSLIDMDCRFYTLYRYRFPIRLFKMWIMSLRFKKRFHWRLGQVLCPLPISLWICMNVAWINP